MADVKFEAEFHRCPDCKTPLMIVNGKVHPGAVVEFHDRLTPTGVAPARITLHTPACTTRGHLNTDERRIL